MRRTVGIVLAAILAVAAFGMWARSSSINVKSPAPPVEASSTPMLPIEFMLKADKDLADKTVREPF